MERLKTPGAEISDLLNRGFLVAEKAIDAKEVYKPSLDIKVSASEYVVVVDLPGVDEDDIQLDMQSGVLTVDVDRDFDHDSEDAEEYVQLERLFGHFHASATLGLDAMFELATAKYKRGVLRVRIPRRRHAK